MFHLYEWIWYVFQDSQAGRADLDKFRNCQANNVPVAFFNLSIRITEAGKTTMKPHRDEFNWQVAVMNPQFQPPAVRILFRTHMHLSRFYSVLEKIFFLFDEFLLVSTVTLWVPPFFSSEFLPRGDLEWNRRYSICYNFFRYKNRVVSSLWLR